MELAAYLGVLRIIMVFAIIALCQKLKRSLEFSLVAASFVLALSCGIWPQDWGLIVAKSCTDITLIALLCAMASILLLSGLMDKSGQSHRLAEAMRRHISSTRVRLLFFPALIGLLPVPGGAIFSCPMVDEVAKGLPVSAEHKGTINYWFRHVWECIWPLYPGFVLFSALVEKNPLEIIAYNWPIWLAGMAAGWIFLLRGIRIEGGQAAIHAEGGSRWTALREASSILTALAGAFLLRLLLPSLPPAFPFAIGFCLGSALCFFMNGMSFGTVRDILTSSRTLGILRVVIAIFMFKAVMIQSGVMQSVGLIMHNSLIALFIACMLLPLVGGMFTGIMVGLVGITFPILIPLVQQAGGWDQRLVWLGMAMMFGYIGQMISPVHVCLVVTCRFFDVHLFDVMRRVGWPCLFLALAAVGWFFLHVRF